MFDRFDFATRRILCVTGGGWGTSTHAAVGAGNLGGSSNTGNSGGGGSSSTQGGSTAPKATKAPSQPGKPKSITVESPASNASTSSVSRTAERTSSGVKSYELGTGATDTTAINRAEVTSAPQPSPVLNANPAPVPIMTGVYGGNSLDGNQSPLDIAELLLLLTGKDEVAPGEDYTADFAGWAVDPSPPVKAKSALLLIGGAVGIFFIYRMVSK